MTTHEHPYPLDRADLIAHLVSEDHGIHPSRYRDMPPGDVLAEHETLHSRMSRADPHADPAVDHPAYYGGEDNPYEVIKVIEAWELDFCLGTSVKYIARAGKKEADKEIQDLKKARWYVDRRIQQLEQLNRCPSCGHPDDNGPPCADMWHVERRRVG